MTALSTAALKMHKKIQVNIFLSPLKKDRNNESTSKRVA